MKGTEVQSTIERFGVENLRVVIIDNSRFYHFNHEDFVHNKVRFNHTNEYMDIKEMGRNGTTPTVVHIPYEFIQSLVFHDPNPNDSIPEEVVPPENP